MTFRPRASPGKRARPLTADLCVSMTVREPRKKEWVKKVVVDLSDTPEDKPKVSKTPP